MIDQLSQTLKNILKEFIDVDFSFDIPKENYAPEPDTINLYLYDIHENRQLRDPVPIYKIVNGLYEKRKPPLRIDCSYMLTAWSSQGGDTASLREHEILSQAFLWLSGFPEIPRDYLPDDWKDESNKYYQPFPVCLSVAQQDGVKQPGDFWAALGSPPRPYLNVVVIISMDVHYGESDSLAQTITKITQYEQLHKPETREEEIRIFGQIINSDEPPTGIPNAKVTIVELKRKTKSDENGNYSFNNIPRNEYTFEVEAVGYESKTVSITIPIKVKGENYNIQLT